ncbi:MAG: sugar ABC transporter substrate-binding protein [Firmicutes bacterium]|nr:sugar ABC transporter substrate-binding protein [Bacillota bacterium]
MLEVFRKNVYQIIFLLICLIVGMAAATQGASKPYAGQTVKIITWETATATAIQKLIPEFEKETGIKVMFEIYPEPVLREKVMLDLASRSGAYDIFLLDGWLTAEYAKAGYVIPLDDLLKNNKSEWFCEDFAPKYLDALRYDGKLWGLPYYGHVGILMYRKDLFEKLGLGVPETTDELMTAAAKLTQKPDRYGIAFRAIKGEDNTIITTSWTWVFGGRWLDEKNMPVVDSPEFIKGVTWIKDILQKYGPPDVSRYSWVEVEKAFTTGRVGMIFDASDFVGRIEDPKRSQIAGKIGYALAPAGPNIPRTKRYASHLFTAGMGINADSRHKEAAWLFLQWMTSSEVQQRTLLEGNNTGVTSLAVLNSNQFRKAYQGVDVILKALELANPEYMPHITVYSELCDIIGTHISAVVAGMEEPADAMKKAKLEMYRALSRAGLIKR